MGKGKRKRTRKARASQRPNKAVRRAQESAARAERLARRALITSPEAEEAVVAAQIAEHFLATTEPIDLAHQMLDAHGEERARRIAEELLALRPQEPAALAFAADIVRHDGDLDRCAELLERAVAVDESDHPGLLFELADAWADVGRRADALEMLWEVCARDPFHVEAQELRGALLEQTREGLRAIDEPCPCRSGKTYGDCCERRETDLRERFLDRSAADEVLDAAFEMLHHPGLDAYLDEGYEHWYGTAEARHRPGVETLDAGLLEERLLTLGITGDDDADCILARLAADPSTPPDLARRTREVLEGWLYGLWQVRSVHDEVGAQLTEIMTGATLYADVGETGPMPRWTVLLGPAYPVDGIWRLGFTERLSPREAEALVPHVYDVMNLVAADALRGKKRRPPMARYDPAMPQSVYVDVEATPEMLPFTSTIIGGALPELMDLVRGWRAMPPQMVNSDGDPIEMITLEIEVADPEAVRAALAARDDVDVRDDEIVWFGREVSPQEVAMTRAELEARGLEVDPDEGPQLYVRGVFTVEGRILRLQTNSRERRDAALRLLEEAGAQPRVRDETRFDPAQDLPAPGEARGPVLRSVPSEGEAVEGMSQAAVDAWQHAWMDESVPALDGLTPRAAARSEDHLPRLVALLREFEYMADRDRLAGRPAADIGALRGELFAHLGD